MKRRTLLRFCPDSHPLSGLLVLAAGLSQLGIKASDAQAQQVERLGCMSSGPDVIVGRLEPSGGTNVANYAPVGAIDAFSIATYACNIGDQDLPWQANTSHHPVIAQAMYRYSLDNNQPRFEQIGLSWVKHGFGANADSVCCTCIGQGGSALNPGCADPYKGLTNGIQHSNPGGLGPRFQVNAHTGVFAYPYMYQNVALPDGGDISISRRLHVHFADLDPSSNPTAHYYIEAQYITPEDAAAGNQNNNVSYCPASIAAVGDPPTDFNADSGFGTTVESSAAIQEWKNLDLGVTETVIDVPEDDGTPTARLIICALATDLGTGFFHYEYALYNMNSDRCVQAFRVPISNGVTVTNIGFHDVDYHSFDGCGSSPSTPITFDGTDWPGTVSGGAVHWNMVELNGVGANAPCNSNALRFGTTYNFRFDADVGPTSGLATLTQWKVVNNVDVSSMIPSSVSCTPGDVNGDGLIDGRDIAPFSLILVQGGGTLTQRCACDLVADGSVDLNDVDPFAALLIGG